MSSKYKFHNPQGIYFISFAVVGWIDVFIRPSYCYILLDSINYWPKNIALLECLKGTTHLRSKAYRKTSVTICNKIHVNIVLINDYKA